MLTPYGSFRGYRGAAALARAPLRRADTAGLMAIYFLWGATYLAIRIAVLEIPPFFTAGVRFLVAGGLLYGFMRLRGQAGPLATGGRSIAVTALCMFVAAYGAPFLAEPYLPFGIALVIQGPFTH